MFEWKASIYVSQSMMHHIIYFRTFDAKLQNRFSISYERIYVSNNLGFSVATPS